MTMGGRLIGCFPSFHLFCIGSAFVYLCTHPGIAGFGYLIAAIYILPVLVFRAHEMLFPQYFGATDLGEKTYSSWWGSFQIQSLFVALPALEGVLRLIPGAYSFWLRLWGAKIGKQIFWSPTIEIVDRSLIEVGDRTVFGHHCRCISHVVNRNEQQGTTVLLVAPIRIGADCLIGAGSAIGPGAVIGDGARLSVLTQVFPQARIAARSKTKIQENVRPKAPLENETNLNAARV